MDVGSAEFSEHALEKMRARHVDKQQVIEAIKDSESLFKDVESNALVAVRRVESRYLVVVFVPMDRGVKVVTVYYASDVDRLIRRKLERGAWRRKG